MTRPTPLRVRAAALATMAQAALIHTLDYLAALLDRRPFSVAALDYAARLGEAWHRHREAARMRRYGPGRGLIAVTLHTPRSTTAERTDASAERKDMP